MKEDINRVAILNAFKEENRSLGSNFVVKNYYDLPEEQKTMEIFQFVFRLLWSSSKKEKNQVRKVL
jgi:hypothetical protein